MTEKLTRYKGNYYVYDDVCLATDVEKLEAKLAEWEACREKLEKRHIQAASEARELGTRSAIINEGAYRMLLMAMPTKLGEG